MTESTGTIPVGELQPEKPWTSDCPGEQVSMMGQVQHDWRLWKRNPWYDSSAEDAYGNWPLKAHNETWYCTRCRKIEERSVQL